MLNAHQSYADGVTGVFITCVSEISDYVSDIFASIFDRFVIYLRYVCDMFARVISDAYRKHIKHLSYTPS